MRIDQWLLASLIVVFLLGVFVWSLCQAIKQDILEARRDRLDYDPGCDAFDLRHSGRTGRDQ